MPNSAQQVTAADQPAETMEELRKRVRELEKLQTRVDERTHTMKNQQMVDMARGRGNNPSPWIGTMISIAGLALLIIGGLWNVSSKVGETTTEIKQRILVLEAQAQVAGPLASRVQTLENAIATARSTRDQQYENLRDRVRSMELSEQTGNQQQQTLAQSMAVTAQRLDDMLRRLAEMERRIMGMPPGTYRQGAPPADDPASYLMGV